jgi:hypothetical protein
LSGPLQTRLDGPLLPLSIAAMHASDSQFSATTLPPAPTQTLNAQPATLNHPNHA